MTRSCLTCSKPFDAPRTKSGERSRARLCPRCREVALTTWRRGSSQARRAHWQQPGYDGHEVARAILGGKK